MRGHDVIQNDIWVWMGWKGLPVCTLTEYINREPGRRRARNPFFINITVCKITIKTSDSSKSFNFNFHIMLVRRYPMRSLETIPETPDHVKLN